MKPRKPDMPHNHIGVCLSFAVLAWCPPALAAEGGQGFDTGAYLLQALLVLVGVVGLIILLAFVLRRIKLFSPRGGGVIRVVGTLPLGTRERLLLVQVSGEQILLGISPGGINKLHRLDNPLDEPQSGVDHAGSGGRFERMLNNLLREGRQ